MDPSSHRLPTSHLAKLTSGRVLSVRYRLAPQNPFPSAILDGLVAYLSLLSPPPGSFHSSVPASNIVFAGDSAGGNLCLALLQTILTLQRHGIKSIRFHRKDVPIQLPAGLALNSPWCDISRAMLSWHANAKYDYIPPPTDFGSVEEDRPADDVWPVTPPRINLYVNASALIHPLVSPLATPAEVWKGAPPVYMCMGNEGLEDEIAVVARRMNEACVEVVLDGYEGMPHCFGLIFPQNPMGRECMNSWGTFIKNAAEDRGDKKKTTFEGVTWAKAFSNPVERVPVPWEELKKKDPGDEEVGQLLRERRNVYVEKEEGMLREWMEKQVQHQQQDSGQSQGHGHSPPKPKL